MNPKIFFGELKRRNVYKVAVAYAVVGWLLIQVATQVFPFLEIPNWMIRLVILLTAFGFPVALIIAWAFELTPEGIKRTEYCMPESTPIYYPNRCNFLALFSHAIPRQFKGSRVAAEKSIAILLFENLSEETGNAYFAEGVQDENPTRCEDRRSQSHFAYIHPAF